MATAKVFGPSCPLVSTFGFEGAELEDFVGLCALTVLRSGAVPVRHAESGPMRWQEQTQYGSTRGAIADAIVAEWLANGGGNPPWEYLWFVTRRVLDGEEALSASW
jgi:hypothetical protein